MSFLQKCCILAVGWFDQRRYDADVRETTQNASDMFIDYAHSMCIARVLGRTRQYYVAHKAGMGLMVICDIKREINICKTGCTTSNVPRTFIWCRTT